MVRSRLMRTTMLAALAVAPGAATAAPAAAAQPAGASAAAPAACPARPRWTTLDLADARAREFPSDFGGRAVNWISLDADGAVFWNGSRVERANLVRYLGIVATMVPRPATVIQRLPGASCDPVTAATAMVEAAYPCQPELCILTSGGTRDSFPPLLMPAPPPGKKTG